MISRRRFLETGAATAALLAWPIRAFPFSQSVLQIPKFKLSLPGLGPGGANELGSYIPVLSPTKETIDGVTTDVYTIEAIAFTQQMLPNLATQQKLWGYAAPGTTPKYLGGVIVATGGKSPVPVELRVANKLPSTHILPVDLSLIDPVVQAETGTRTDRIAVHLHGGFVFWCFDGTPFTWYANPANSGGFVHGSSFIAENEFAPGTAVYRYANQQSARTIWYHDHAYGLTRTNVYAGLASAYLITDNDPDGEMGLISKGIIPGLLFGGQSSPETGGLGFPLIIQDKTFWDPASNDPTYSSPSVVPGAVKGDLWYPHIYEGAQLADLPFMSLPADASLSPSPKARWELGTGTPPTLSSVPEFFSDTMLVNGAPYPTLDVDPKRYRFRFLNASQARFFNLQLYVGDTSKDGITLVQIGPTTVADNLDNNGNVLLVPQNAPGPAFIQIANEAGFLPEPALFSTTPTTNLNSNRVMKYKNATDVRTHRRRADGPDRALPGDPTLGNANQHNLLMAPAERADVIIDFRGFAAGTELILYNDAPGPFPGGDTRNDYFVLTDAAGLAAGYNDLTPLGGAPPPVTGFGPDTRVLMKFVVSTAVASTEPDFEDTVTQLQSTSEGLPFVFANTQPPTNISGKTFVKTLNEDKDEFGRLRQLLGVVPLPAVQTYLDFPTEVAMNGEVQEWQIYNLTADTHPMHFHLVNVHVLKREQWAFNPDGSPKIPLSIMPNSALPVDENEAGWKETVRMNPGEVTTVVMQFALPTGAGAGKPPENSPRLLASYGIKGFEYVWHCHILEHEEHDMMHAVVVLPG